MDNEFCKPSDFYYLNKQVLKQMMEQPGVKFKFKLVFFLVLWFIITTLLMVGYYITYPFKWINEKCEKWCYY